MCDYVCCVCTCMCVCMHCMCLCLHVYVGIYNIPDIVGSHKNVHENHDFIPTVCLWVQEQMRPSMMLSMLPLIRE